MQPLFKLTNSKTTTTLQSILPVTAMDQNFLLAIHGFTPRLDFYFIHPLWNIKKIIVIQIIEWTVIDINPSKAF
ncbi:hypothetical protein DHC50_03540 [Arenibacter sp. A80]|nr:hypothetical protein [Arenibacter sp. A80]RFT58223.1 hypothetical protein D0S24_03540 [Arenibacter sp. P308M17]